MNKISLKELAELNNAEFDLYRRKLKLKNHLNECGLKWIDIEVGVHNDMFALEATVCNFDNELKTKLSESSVLYDEFNLKIVNMDDIPSVLIKKRKQVSK